VRSASGARRRRTHACGSKSGSDPAPNVNPIADTGLIVALLAADDPYHAWAADAFRRHSPFHACDAVLAEACSFLPDSRPVLKLVARGDLILGFDLAAELPKVLALATKYADRPMDLADACVVRMSELQPSCRVWTVDRSDFAVYRRDGRQAVPCEFPPAH
jgi:predicted nucleic acid-binding protein